MADAPRPSKAPKGYLPAVGEKVMVPGLKGGEASPGSAASSGHPGHHRGPAEVADVELTARRDELGRAPLVSEPGEVTVSCHFFSL
eukprot:CAMPEP_0203867644 /NCGR_PEP_ID=MMETSP0359-20131031/16643_1 /ASSEMBLY_ACC=CAM_ASM_000338 /TAXON_ID=268821 /ORGANISM="Scrippsiella Hangoei, Strain SHTV-5" /LENGTH=85 /DNA_ID=CAMNT_0050785923 /DNA_START=86 /DNA_END=344 /DNA_ORIENTATION=+